jgi:hypothetical protein
VRTRGLESSVRCALISRLTLESASRQFALPNECQKPFPANERPLGESSYTVTFPKGQLPPVKGLWSLTMYNPAHFFYPNALKRYALGTKNKSLKYNDDGGLTIYLENKSPGKEKESNWLPAPAGNFSIWLRAYWPDQAILDGNWKPPVVQKIN